MCTWTNQLRFLNFSTGGKRMKKIAISLLALTLGLVLAVPAMAGPGTVEVTVPGDISLRMGAQVRMVPTAELDKDFGLSDDLPGTLEPRAAAAMGGLGLGLLGNSTRSHLTETAGAVKDSYVRTEDRLFFNFAKGKDWDVYMMLEVDEPLSRSSADRTDFGAGKQSQQFGIERLQASFNIPGLSSRLKAGWDARGIDIGYGGFVYGDDDPGIGLVGGANGFKWEAWWIKKDEKEAAYGSSANNATGLTDPDKDADRTFYYAKLGHDFDSTYLEAFGFFHQNHITGRKVDHYIAGLQGKGTYGIVMPTFEFAYATGDWEHGTSRADSLDIESFALYGDVALDLHEMVDMKKFEVHVGGYYVQGDDDATDDDLEGFAPVVGINRFTPRFGSDGAGIVYDGNPILGQILYSSFPAYYGHHAGAGINGGGNFDNPGFVMVGGGLKAGWDKYTYITNVMAMWFDETAAIEYDYGVILGVENAKIDDSMGIEWNNEIRYKLFDSVTLKGAASFLFPGDGVKDITQALDAYARAPEDAEDIHFADGNSSDNVQMRFAAEIVWFF
jgi:hypothetical protein